MSETMTDEEWEASVPTPPSNPQADHPVETYTFDATGDVPPEPDGSQDESDTGDGAVAIAEAEPAVEAAEEKAPRRPKGWLANDVRIVCDKLVRGEISLPDGTKPTPHHVARLVQKLDSLEKAPSTGAVNAVFQRWEEYGYATFSSEPRAFVDFTDEGRTVGLSGLLAGRAEQRKAARAAEKAAKAAEAPPVTPEPAPEPAPEPPVDPGNPDNVEPHTPDGTTPDAV